MDKVDEAKDKAMDAKDVFVEKVGEEKHSDDKKTKLRML